MSEKIYQFAHTCSWRDFPFVNRSDIDNKYCTYVASDNNIPTRNAFTMALVARNASARLREAVQSEWQVRISHHNR